MSDTLASAPESQEHGSLDGLLQILSCELCSSLKDSKVSRSYLGEPEEFWQSPKEFNWNHTNGTGEDEDCHGLTVADPSQITEKDAIRMVDEDGLNLGTLSKELRNTKEVVMRAVIQNGIALKFASQELRNDCEVVRKAVR